MKFCKDCHHIRCSNRPSQLRFAKCGHPQAITKREIVTEQLVDGTFTGGLVDYLYCSTMRGSSRLCGSEGRFFEPGVIIDESSTPPKATIAVKEVVPPTPPIPVNRIKLNLQDPFTVVIVVIWLLCVAVLLAFFGVMMAPQPQPLQIESP